MLDVKSLERRWLKYKIKSYLPILGSIVGLVIIIIASLWWFNHESAKGSHEKIKKYQPLPEKNTSIQIPKISAPVENNTTVLEPSMDFVQSFENLPTLNEQAQKQPIQKSQTTIPKPVASLPPPQVLKMPEPPLTNTLSPKVPLSGSSKTLTINRNESKLDIEELQIRFKETSNANLGLFIARYYYDQGNYTESYNYALKTNAINNRIDESWIIFAKSLVKLGKTDQAKKTLQFYISQSNSDTAKELLNSIERGSFK